MALESVINSKDVLLLKMLLRNDEMIERLS